MELHCICGYKYKKYYDDDEPELGDETFIELELSNHININMVGTGDSYYGPDKATLYACPKCHTVKIG